MYVQDGVINAKSIDTIGIMEENIQKMELIILKNLLSALNVKLLLI